MRNLLITLLILIILHPANAQTDGQLRIQKLEQSLKSATGSQEVDLLIELTDEYLFYDLDKAFRSAHLALQKAQSRKYLRGSFAAKVALGNCYLYRSEGEDLLNAFNNYIEVIEYPIGEQKACPLLLEKAKALNGIGNLYYLWGDYQKAIAAHMEALHLREQCDDETGIARCYNSIGLIYDSMGSYDEAIRHYSKALNIYEKQQRLRDIAGTLNNLAAATHIKLLKSNSAASYEQVIDYYQRALQISQQLKDQRGMARIFNNLGIIYQEQQLFEKALDYFFKAATIDEEEQDWKEAAATFSNIARMFESRNEWLVAINYYQKAAEAATHIQAKSDLLVAFEGLARVYEQLKDHYQAYQYLLLAKRLQRELFDIETNRRITLLSSQYELEKKQKQIELLEKQQALQLLENQRTRQYVLIAGLFIVLLTAVLLLLYMRYRLKSKLSEQLQTLYAELETQYQRVEDSIQYAQRLQAAMLPKTEELLNPFREVVLFYRPKSIVSGDFYWCKSIADAKVIVVGDCTGHGVPGAIMTVLAMNLLDELVSEMHTQLDAAHILYQLDQRIQRTLADDQIHDGLDGAVLIVRGQSVEFAGAHMALYLFHQSKMFVFKPNRLSIGYKDQRKEKRFSKHSLQLNPGDRLYLYSDGFPDQFGEGNQKKYMSKRFRLFLQQIAHLPMHEQKQRLQAEFERWKGNNEQTDDVIVLGLMY